MQLKFSLHHGLQRAVVDKGKHAEACNKLSEVGQWIQGPRTYDIYVLHDVNICSLSNSASYDVMIAYR